MTGSRGGPEKGDERERTRVRGRDGNLFLSLLAKVQTNEIPREINVQVLRTVVRFPRQDSIPSESRLPEERARFVAVLSASCATEKGAKVRGSTVRLFASIRRRSSAMTHRRERPVRAKKYNPREERSGGKK